MMDAVQEKPAKADPKPRRGNHASGPASAGRTTKAASVVALLTRPKGASLHDIMKATGWQAHSVRGFLAGTLKKKLGRTVTSEKTDKGRIYRIAAPGGAA